MIAAGGPAWIAPACEIEPESPLIGAVKDIVRSDSEQHRRVLENRFTILFKS